MIDISDQEEGATPQKTPNFNTRSQGVPYSPRDFLRRKSLMGDLPRRRYSHRKFSLAPRVLPSSKERMFSTPQACPQTPYLSRAMRDVLWTPQHRKDLTDQAMKVLSESPDMKERLFGHGKEQKENPGESINLIEFSLDEKTPQKQRIARPAEQTPDMSQTMKNMFKTPYTGSPRKTYRSPDISHGSQAMNITHRSPMERVARPEFQTPQREPAMKEMHQSPRLVEGTPQTSQAMNYTYTSPVERGQAMEEVSPEKTPRASNNAYRYPQSEEYARREMHQSPQANESFDYELDQQLFTIPSIQRISRKIIFRNVFGKICSNMYPHFIQKMGDLFEIPYDD